jgi:TRAP-type uncharacterized transport system substrate-binding protein
MAWWARRVVVRVFITVAALVAAIWLALWYFIPAPPHELTIAAGIKGGAFEHFANRYKELLARHHVTLNLHFASAGLETLRLAANPTSEISGGFLFGGFATGETAPNIVSLGRINAAPFWIFYRGSEPLDRLSQLKGKRAYVTAIIGGNLLERILAANGVKRGDMMMVSPEKGSPEAAKLLQAGEIDVAILPPIDLYAPPIQAMLRDPNIRLMNVGQAEAITRLFPSVNKLVLPQGVVDLEKNIPPNDVNLIGSTSVFVVRKDLHPELIHLLAEVLKEVHSGGGVFQRPGEFPSVYDPEFPVAEEALDYYRNGPSFLQRYLPFWMINYAKRIAAIVVTAIALVIPLLTYGPKIYEWFLGVYIRKLYRRLRIIETSLLEAELNASQLKALQTDLESVSQGVKLVPLQHSDLFVDLIMHIRLARAELASRAAALIG